MFRVYIFNHQDIRRQIFVKHSDTGKSEVIFLFIIIPRVNSFLQKRGDIRELPPTDMPTPSGMVKNGIRDKREKRSGCLVKL